MNAEHGSPTKTGNNTTTGMQQQFKMLEAIEN